MPRRPKISKAIEEMEDASAEAVPTPSAPASFPPEPAPSRAPPLESRYAEPLARIYVSLVLPVLGGLLVAVAARLVLSLYELLAVGLGLYFLSWAFRCKPKTTGVTTWEQAREVTGRATFHLGLVPVAACVSFVVINWLAGMMWGYAVTTALVAMCIVLAEGSLARPAAAKQSTERGQKTGGIDDKLREEYEKARRQQSGKG